MGAQRKQWIRVNDFGQCEMNEVQGRMSSTVHLMTGTYGPGVQYLVRLSNIAQIRQKRLEISH
jgi:hypothetical protein